MLARPVLRPLRRRLVPALAPPRSPSALVSTSPARRDTPVSFVSYLGGQRGQTEVGVPHDKGRADGAAPVATEGGDAQTTAVPLTRAAYAGLTPTLRRFALNDKVAVVSG